MSVPEPPLSALELVVLIGGPRDGLELQLTADAVAAGIIYVPVIRPASIVQPLDVGLVSKAEYQALVGAMGHKSRDDQGRLRFQFVRADR